MQLDFGINAGLVEELYAQFLENPDSVDPSWRSYFEERLASTAGRAQIVRWPRGLPLTDGDLARSIGDAIRPDASAALALDRDIAPASSLPAQPSWPPPSRAN